MILFIYNLIMSQKEIHSQIIQMEYEDIINSFGDSKNKMKYVKFYKDWIDHNKKIILTPQKKLENELKWGLYMYIKKDD